MSIDKCEIQLKRNEHGRMELVIDELNPACRKALEEIAGNSGKFERKYLRRVIKTDNPETAKFLEGIRLK